MQYCSHADDSLRLSEASSRPDPALCHRIGARNRATLVDWILDVTEEFSLRADTLFLGVDLIDRHLSYWDESTKWLQLVGTACLWTACKVEEMASPSAADMVCLTRGAYTKAQLAHMERRLLQATQYAVVKPTAYTFLSTLLHVSEQEQKWGPAPTGCCNMCYWEACAHEAVAMASYRSAHSHAKLAASRSDADYSSSNDWSSELDKLETSDMALASMRVSMDVSSSASSTSMSQHVPCNANVVCDNHCHTSSTSKCTGGKKAVAPNNVDSDDMLDQDTKPRRNKSTHCHASQSQAGGSQGSTTTTINMWNGAATRQSSVTSTASRSYREQEHARLSYLARFIAETCLLDEQMMHFLPSQIAAASYMLASAMLRLPLWTPCLAQQSAITGPEDVAACVVMVAEAYARARQDPELVTFRRRYGAKRMNIFDLNPNDEAMRLVAACCQACCSPCMPLRAVHSDGGQSRRSSRTSRSQQLPTSRQPHVQQNPAVVLDSSRTNIPGHVATSSNSISAQLPAVNSRQPALIPMSVMQNQAYASYVSSSSGHVKSIPAVSATSIAACHRYLEIQVAGHAAHDLCMAPPDSPTCTLAHAMHSSAWGSVATDSATDVSVSLSTAELMSSLSLNAMINCSLVPSQHLPLPINARIQDM